MSPNIQRLLTNMCPQESREYDFFSDVSMNFSWRGFREPKRVRQAQQETIQADVVLSETGWHIENQTYTTMACARSARLARPYVPMSHFTPYMMLAFQLDWQYMIRSVVSDAVRKIPLCPAYCWIPHNFTRKYVQWKLPTTTKSGG